MICNDLTILGRDQRPLGNIVLFGALRRLKMIQKSSSGAGEGESRTLWAAGFELLINIQ